MIQENQNQCQWMLTVADHEHNCVRTAENSKYCILHDPSPDKDETIFLQELQTIIDTNEKHNDFRGIHFFTTGGLLQRTYNRIANFEGAHFHCNADFKGAQFDVSYSFLKAIFDRNADFSGQCRMRNGSFANATFHGSCTFADASFQERTDLSDVTFMKETSFRKIEFTDSKLVMNGTQFIGFTSFEGCQNHRPESQFILENCNLQGLLLTELSMFPERFITKNCTWPNRIYMGFLRGRLLIADELASKDKKQVLGAYRRLHQYFFVNSEFDIASEFYVSFMVMRRKVEKLRKGSKLFAFIYSILSRYGESVGRPFWALIGMWLLVPIMLLLLGIQLVPGEPVVQYSLTSDGTPFLFMSDYWKTFQLSLSQSTLFRGGDLRPALTSVQHTFLLFETLLNALLVSFLALGIRRKFAPKKPD